MAVGKIRTSSPGDPSRLKKELKDSGNDKWFWRVAADTDVTVRFMAEPWDFISYMNHFMDKTSFPCNEGDCKGCDEGNSANKTWVAPVLDVENKRVRAMVVPKTLVDQLAKIAERAGTIMDRDIVISREGSTMENTKYGLYAESKKRRDMTIFEEPDIVAMLEDMLDEALNDDGDDDPPPRRGSNKKATKRAGTSKNSSSRRAPWDEDDDQEERPRSATGAARRRRTDDDDDPPSRRGVVKKTAKTSLRRSAGSTTSPKKSMRRR